MFTTNFFLVKIELGNILQVICNLKLRMHGVNEGYFELQLGDDNEIGNKHPFNLIVHTDSKNMEEIIRKKQRIIKRTINETMKRKFKMIRKRNLLDYKAHKKMRESFLPHRSEYADLEDQVGMKYKKMKFYDWKINKIETAELQFQKDDFRYQLLTLEEELYDGYGIK